MSATAAILATALLALPLAPGHAEITSRRDNAADPRCWSAVAGLTPRAVRDLVRHLPPSDQSATRPWCSPAAEVEATLRLDFLEERIGRGRQDTTLWGSEQRGTWTMLLERPDAVDCVIASGTGFSRRRPPDYYFDKAGLGG